MSIFNNIHASTCVRIQIITDPTEYQKLEEKIKSTQDLHTLSAKDLMQYNVNLMFIIVMIVKKY